MGKQCRLSIMNNGPRALASSAMIYMEYYNSMQSVGSYFSSWVCEQYHARPKVERDVVHIRNEK